MLNQNLLKTFQEKVDLESTLSYYIFDKYAIRFERGRLIFNFSGILSKKLNIYNFGIRKNYRFKGYGPPIVKEIVNFAYENNIKKIVIYDVIEPDFWSKCGFKRSIIFGLTYYINIK